MWKYACVIILVLSSFYGGFKYSQAPSIVATDATSEEMYKTKYENLQRQIQKIHAVDFEEYMSLKEQKEKYLKADEILGKIFLIFLAEAGLKLSQKDLQHVKNAAIGKTALPEEPIAQKEDFEDSKKSAALPKPVVKPEWIKYEKNLKAVNSAKDNEEQLKEVEIKDLFSALKNSKSMGMDMAQKISGVFEGTVNLDKDQEVWLMEMDLEVQSMGPKGEIQGQHKVSFAEPGKDPFSTSNGGWDAGTFLVPEGDSQAFFMKIRAKGREGYLQLYFVDGYRKLVGNYYDPVSLDQFKKAGTVLLSKK